MREYIAEEKLEEMEDYYRWEIEFKQKYGRNKNES